MSNESTNPITVDDIDRLSAQEQSKRAALAGQWRTPPLPVFPTSQALGASDPNGVQSSIFSQPAPATHPDSVMSVAGDISSSLPPVNEAALPPVDSLPDSTEDYAKALQEAYRRGAEAAAAMAAARSAHPLLSGAVSCPDFSGSLMRAQSQGSMLAVPAATQEDVAMHTPSSVPNPLANPTSVAAMPQPPPPTAAHPPPQAHAPVARPLPPVQPPRGVGGHGVGVGVGGHTQRSMSLPDMTSFAAQQEEEKRQKRLARNRASARLRRLRKKNLVSFLLGSSSALLLSDRRSSRILFPE
jgi:hypothetical protein